MYFSWLSCMTTHPCRRLTKWISSLYAHGSWPLITFDDVWWKTGRTIIPVSVVQQLLSLPLVLLCTPQLPCKQTDALKHNLPRMLKDFTVELQGLLHLLYRHVLLNYFNWAILSCVWNMYVNFLKVVSCKFVNWKIVNWLFTGTDPTSQAPCLLLWSVSWLLSAAGNSSLWNK